MRATMVPIAWVAVLAVLPSFADETYVTELLPPLESYHGSVVLSVSAEGRSVGFSERSERDERETEATVWTLAGGARRLAWDGPFELEGYRTEAIDINDRGDILGVGRRPDTSEVLLFWPAGGRDPHWIEVVGHVRRAGLNEDGLIFAEIQPPGTAPIEARVLRFDRRFETWGVQLAGLFPGASTLVFDMAPDGTVAGASTTPDGRTRPVLWRPSEDGSEYTLSVLPAAGDVGFARSAGSGGSEAAVIGAVVEESGSRAVAWEQGNLVELGVPEGFDEVEVFGTDADGYALCIVVRRDADGAVLEDAIWWKRSSDGDSFFVVAPDGGRLSSAAVGSGGRIALNVTAEDGLGQAYLLSPPLLDTRSLSLREEGP